MAGANKENLQTKRLICALSVVIAMITIAAVVVVGIVIATPKQKKLLSTSDWNTTATDSVGTLLPSSELPHRFLELLTAVPTAAKPSSSLRPTIGETLDVAI